ncbi:MAG: hypothetical protein H8D78_02650 [Chloroflexi bacterium]|nr:hypothetical protein [Chloroflexota bacterium]
MPARLFGNLTPAWGNAALSSITSRSARSLFAYLIAYRHCAHGRDLLAGAFWPHSTNTLILRNRRL